MTRLRKASRIWKSQKAQIAVQKLLINDSDGEACAFEVDPERWFQRSAPLEVEIGAGKGEFIIERAQQFPERNFLAVELPPSLVRLLCVRIAQSGATNVKVLRADARSLVGFLMPPSSVLAYHIYYPDPWPKARHAKHRLFSPNFIEGLKRTLVKDGVLYFATDVAEWASYVFTSLVNAGFQCIAEQAPGTLKTGYGRKYHAENKKLFAYSFTASDMA